MKIVLLNLIIFESLLTFFLLCYKLFEKVETTYTFFFKSMDCTYQFTCPQDRGVIGL